MFINMSFIVAILIYKMAMFWHFIKATTLVLCKVMFISTEMLITCESDKSKF